MSLLLSGCGLEVCLLLHELATHVLLKLGDVFPPLVDLVLEILLEFVHALDLFGDVLNTLLDIALCLVGVLLSEDWPHQLEDGGIAAHEIELGEDHFVLGLLLNERLLSSEDLLEFLLDFLDLRDLGLKFLLNFRLLLHKGGGDAGGELRGHFQIY